MSNKDENPRAAVAASQAAPTVKMLREAADIIVELADSHGAHSDKSMAWMERSLPVIDALEAGAPVASQAAPVGDLTTVDCPTCNGHGLIGGHSGQTPESYEEHATGCDDCDGQGKVIVSRKDRAAVAAAKVPTGASPVAQVGGSDKSELHVRWMRPEACNLGDYLYLAAPVEQGQGAGPEGGREAQAKEPETRMDSSLEGGHEQGQGAAFGMRVIVDPALPPDSMEVRSGKNTVRAVNIGQGAGVVPEAFLAAELPSAEVVYRASDMQQAAATAHPVAADDQVRDQALEEAAKTAEATRVATVQYGLSLFQDGDGTRRDIAEAIRAKKSASRTTAHATETPATKGDAQ